MSQDRITFRTDSQDKRQFEQLVSALGLTTSGALNLFIKTAVREQRLPIDLAIDPLMDPLERARVNQILDERQALIDSGSAQLVEHEDVRDLLGL